ncbi:MAG: nitronate monooxygenase [Pseudomonadota bacterium]
MQSPLMAWFDMQAPVFAFSHCRDVVAAVSRAGGFGVLGTTHVTPEQLELELTWLDEHTNGRPYGVDVMFASRPLEGSEQLSVTDIERVIPEENRRFVNELLARYDVPELSEADSQALLEEYMGGLLRTHAEAVRRLDVVFRHPQHIKMIVSALGVPPVDQIERAHALDMKVGAMVGQVRHVPYHLQANVDVLIAAGYEAAGHNSDVATLVLTPQIVDAAGSTPVIHAGGVARGRQIAAALALGAQAVWTGTLWLGTAEAETSELIKRKIFAASSADTVRSSANTGKPTRRLTSAWTEAWRSPDAPAPLPKPLQSILINEALDRIDKYEPEPLVTYPAGKAVGMLTEKTDVRTLMYELLAEFGETLERLQGDFGGEA